jgi:hypothetical protein
MWDNARRSGADMLPSAHSNAVPWGVAATSAASALGLQNHLPAGVRNRMSAAANLAAKANPFAPVPTGGSGSGGGSGTTDSPLMSDYKYAGLAGSIERHQQAGVAGSLAAGNAQQAAWNSSREGQLAQGKNAYAGNVQSAAEFEAQSAAWEAKQAFGSHVSAMAGIAGMNAGSLQAGNKPQEMTGMAMSGMLDAYNSDGKKTSDVSGAASYAGFGYQALATQTAADGNANYGWGYVDQFKPVGAVDIFPQGQAAKANMDVYSAGMAKTVNDPVGAATSFAKDPFGTAAAPIKNAMENFGTSFKGTASRDQSGLNFSAPAPAPAAEPPKK